MSIFNSLLEPQQYLLIPAMPTPNGRLHLGHMAGPFLKMDMLARTFRRSGHLADVMSASDVYESYVLRKAHQTGLSVEAVCEQYHALIKEDMEALMLDCTAYFNPLTRAYREKTDFYYRDTLEALVESGTAYQRAEKVLYSPEADKYIVGTWLQGDCPHCGSGAGSYLCEACGMQFNPEDVVNPSSTTGETDLEETEVDTLFLKVKEENLLMERIRQMGIREEMVDVVKQYMHHYDGEVRLTNPGNWGTQWTDEQLRGSNYHVVFPYSGLFSLSRICGEILADKYSLDKNPFDQGSSVTTIASFGIDSTIPWFVGVLGANLAADRFKPFDYFLTNYFYQLEGKKFSTSRLHVIWAADIVNKTKASSDAVRYYLISRSPETQESNFDIQDFIQFNNAFLVEDFSRLLSMVWSNWEIAVQNPIPESLKLDLEKAFTEQANCWEPPAQELLKGLQVLEQWLQSVAASSDWQSQPYWMLKSISLMCYPIMPKMSQEIWTLLGAEGAPATATFLQLSSPEAKTELPIFFETITYEDLLPCLPATLTEKSSENGHPIAKPKVKLDFMAPWFEADAIKVEEVDLTQDKERFAPFKASRFEVFPGKTSPVDIHEVRECWFISEGQGSLIYNGEKLQEVKAGEVLYFDSHQSHAIENTGDSNLVIFSTWWKP